MLEWKVGDKAAVRAVCYPFLPGKVTIVRVSPQSITTADGLRWEKEDGIWYGVNTLNRRQQIVAWSEAHDKFIEEHKKSNKLESMRITIHNAVDRAGEATLNDILKLINKG